MFTQNLHGLAPDQIMQAVPSVYAEAAHASRSGRYTYIPTSMVLSGLHDAGFVPTTAMQSRSRVEGKQAFTKHLLRLRKVDDLGYSKPEVHEIVLVNSHDGTSAYNLYSGIFRLVCTNGLIRGDFTSQMKVYHKGDIVGQVVESTLRIVEESEQVMEEVEAMKQITLSHPEQLLLAESAMSVRFDLEDEGESKKVVVYQPSDFLRIRRMADAKHDLWTVLNTIQENMIKGGVSRRDSNWHKHRTREIRGIDQSVKINRLLWQFAQKMMELKS